MDKSYGNTGSKAENAPNHFIDTTYGAKLDSNGYAPSLLSHDDSCYFGHGLETVRHEVFFGPNRTNSKRTGMWCCVCVMCHREIHESNPEKDKRLKREAQEIFESVRSHEDFIAIFGRSYT